MRRLTAITIILLFSLFLSGCNKKAVDSNSQTENNTQNNRLLINALERSKRPFVVMIPNSSNKYLTLYLDKIVSDINSISLDIEYLSGTSLKGGRVTPSFPIDLPHAQAFLLGSCSSGGKCSFDKDLISGTIKSRLDFNDGQGHVLKSDYVFVEGQVSTPDSKVTYSPKNSKQTGQILIDTQGYPGQISAETVFNPIAITAVGSTKIQGTLKIKADGATKGLIYDGEAYQSLEIKNIDGQVEISLNHQPWHKNVEVVRDDLKGTTESVDLYLLGPIILTK